MELFGMTSFERSVEQFMDINVAYETGLCYKRYIIYML